jgi:hypothetical protein
MFKSPSPAVVLYITALAGVASFVLPFGAPDNKAVRVGTGLTQSPCDTRPNITTGDAFFSIPQVPNPNFRNRTGLEVLLLTYAKYGVPLTPELEHALAVNEHVEHMRSFTKRTY